MVGRSETRGEERGVGQDKRREECKPVGLQLRPTTRYLITFNA